MSKMYLANSMIDIAVEHSIHRSGRKHADTSPQKVLELLAGELIELTAANANQNRVELDFEVADVYIALRHFQKKINLTDEELAKCIAHKLDSRNAFPNSVPSLEVERFKSLQHEIVYK